MYLEKGGGDYPTVYSCFSYNKKNRMFIKLLKASYREGGNTCVGMMLKLGIWYIPYFIDLMLEPDTYLK